MDARDAHGQPIKVGDTVNITAKVIDIVPAGDDAMLVCLTALPHGPFKTVYSIPTIHGSQVTKA